MSDNAMVEAPPVPRFYRRGRFWVVTLLLLPFFILTVVWSFRRWSLNEELAAVRAAGLPTNGEELNDFYVVPEDQTDTTLLWVDAIRGVTNLQLTEAEKLLPFVGDGEEPIAGKEWADLETARVFLQNLHKEFTLIRNAADAGGTARFPVDFSLGINTLLPDTQESRTVARLLVLDAHVKARSGDDDVALQDIVGVFRLSDAFQAEPSLVSQLVRLAIHSIGCDTVEKLLPVCEWDDLQLAALQLAAGSASFKESLRCAMIGERATVLTAIGENPIMALDNSNKMTALELFEMAIESIDQPWPETIRGQKEVADNLQANSRGLTGKQNFMVQLLFPATERAAIASARSTARQRATITAIAAERHRQKNGAFPESLNEVSEDVFPPGKQSPAALITDPFDGEMLRYRKSETAVMIYSVGRNGEDDGGEIHAENGQLPDIGVSMQR